MAGFFGIFDYSKPGPGVSKDAPQKHRFFLFFEIFFRKFWNLVSINLLYFVFCIPIVTIGPATAGFTCIVRNFAREEHAFIWMDFWDTFKKNWKQSLAVSIINAVLDFVLVESLYFWHGQYLKSLYMIVPFALCASFAVIFLFMHYYLYVLIITFRLNLKQIYKNAFLFAFLGLLRNILITVILGVLTYALVLFWRISVIIVVPIIALSFGGLLINFNTWPLIKKYMVDPYNEKHPEEALTTDDDGQQVFNDIGRERKGKK
ncbi:MAG: YesL family protein [Clostridia bacterium]|nr:YesL family protein [Clostridia bacterium]